MWIMLLMSSGWLVQDQAGQFGNSGEYRMGRECVMDRKFGAPMVVAPACVSKEPRQLCLL
jgi:hypothetical protein